MTARPLLWIIRLVGIAVFSLSHYVVLHDIAAKDLAASHAQGESGEDLGEVYRESPQGRQNIAIIKVMSWPILTPYNIIHERYSTAAPESTWDLIGDIATYANSLTWGIGGWIFIEIIVGGFFRSFRRE